MDRVQPRLMREPGTWICLAITVAGILLKLWWLEPVGPVVFFDELRYKLGAEAMAGNGPYPSGHYPFLYPLGLAPALLAGAGYHGIFVSNVVMSSLVVPACFLLARSLGMRHAWVVAVPASLLTLHAVFPTQVMSENLFVPAFTFATWVAVRGRPASLPGALAYGLLLGGLFLIKYLALPAIPLLWALWLANQRHPPTDGPGQAPGHGWVRPGVASALSAAAFVGIWLWYARTQGIAFARALGAGVSGVANDGAVTPQPDAIVVWAVAYLAVIVLIAGPFLALFVGALARFAAAPLRHLRESRMARFLLLVALLTGGYWLVCIQHSASGAANYPVPQRVVARYLMLLGPLYLVAGLALLEDRRFQPGRLARAVFAAIGVAAVLASVRVLYHDQIGDFPDWFAAIPLYASDIMWYSVAPLCGAALVLLATAPFAGGHRFARLAWIAALCALLFAGLQEVDERGRRTSTSRPVHARVLLPFVQSAIAQEGHVTILSGVPESPRDLRMALIFWGVDGNAIRTARASEGAPPGKWRKGPVLLATATPVPGRVLQRYEFLGRVAYVVDATQGDPPGWKRPEGPRLQAAPAALCGGVADGPVTVRWDVGDAAAASVDVNLVNGRTGQESLFARGGPRGRATTGDWVRPYTTFRLRPTGSDRLLDELVVGLASDCGEAVPR